MSLNTYMGAGPVAQQRGNVAHTGQVVRVKVNAKTTCFLECDAADTPTAGNAARGAAAACSCHRQFCWHCGKKDLDLPSCPALLIVALLQVCFLSCFCFLPPTHESRFAAPLCVDSDPADG